MDHVRTNPELGVMAHTCNPSTQEAEMGESPRSSRLAWITQQVPVQADPVSRNSHRQTERTKRAGEIVCLVKGMLLITRTLVQAPQATKNARYVGAHLFPRTGEQRQVGPCGPLVVSHACSGQWETLSQNKVNSFSGTYDLHAGSPAHSHTPTPHTHTKTKLKCELFLF